MSNLILRKATAEDSEFAYQAKKAAFREYVEKIWGWDEKEQRRLHERRFARQNFHVMQVSGVDVGVIAIVRQPECITVKQMFILPDFQNKGIGTACMKSIIQDAIASGLPIRLQVLKVNGRAIEFYRRLGFKSINKSDNHVIMERPS